MSPHPNRSKLPNFVGLLFVVVFSIWWLTLSLYSWMGIGVGAALDLLLALVLWISIFSGQPVLALLAEKRGWYKRLHAQAQPRFFDFLLVLTGKLGWLFFVRFVVAVAQLLSLSFREWSSPRFDSFFWTAGAVLLTVEYFSVRKELTKASTLNRRAS